MTSPLDSTDLLIRTLPTPNPYALKFIANAPLKSEGKATFNTPDECVDLPLVRDLFTVPGVKQVHLFQNTATVTHSGEIESDDLEAQVVSVLRNRYEVHDPNFGPPPVPAGRPRVRSDDPRIEAIEEILDRTIRPGLQADGGDIEILSFADNELRIVYQGACGGCPSSMMGTLDAIQGILRHELSNDQIVVIPE